MNSSNIKKLVIVLPFVLIAASPFMALAVNNNVWDVTILKGPLVTCTGLGCQSLCDLVATVVHVVYYFIAVVIWIITPFMVAWSGIALMLSQGNPGKRDNARKLVTSTVIGLFIVLCAYLIVYTFVSVLGIAGVGGFGSGACP